MKQPRKAQTPPLDTDFFTLCKFHQVGQPFEVLRKYVQEAYSIDIAGSRCPRLEEIFGMVYSDTRMEPIPAGAREAFAALCRVYTKVLLNSTNWIEPSNRGPLGALLRHLSSLGESTVITFNQDLVIEKALCALKPDQPLWFPDTGYGISFDAYTMPIRKSPAEEDDLPEFFALGNGRVSTVPILKLHGSLNWYTTTRSATDVPSTMRATAKYKCTQRRSIPPQLTFTYPGKRGRKRWYTWPVIVPPVYEKGAFIGTALGPVWEAARRSLEGATTIVVYGYSFPLGDQQGRSFFRRARASNGALKCVVVINPDQNAAAEAREVLSPPGMVVANSVRDYLGLSFRAP